MKFSCFYTEQLHLVLNELRTWCSDLTATSCIDWTGNTTLFSSFSSFEFSLFIHSSVLRYSVVHSTVFVAFLYLSSFSKAQFSVNASFDVKGRLEVSSLMASLCFVCLFVFSWFYMLLVCCSSSLYFSLQYIILHVSFLV